MAALAASTYPDSDDQPGTSTGIDYAHVGGGGTGPTVPTTGQIWPRGNP